VLWVSAVIIIFGVSFQKLQGLQAPLASLNAAAHVRYRFARCRLMSNMYGFAEDPAQVTEFREMLRAELRLLKQEYDALLYGGEIPTVVSEWRGTRCVLGCGTAEQCLPGIRRVRRRHVTAHTHTHTHARTHTRTHARTRAQAPNLDFDANAPPAAFANDKFSHIFFKTTDCLRVDKSQCYSPSSEWCVRARAHKGWCWRTVGGQSVPATCSLPCVTAVVYDPLTHTSTHAHIALTGMA
jgi:hypothetical protein